MRWIDPIKLKLPQGWEAKSQSKQADIDNGVCEPGACYDVWSSLKHKLAEMSDNKCWYCESREERSDNTVDHFRPKSIYPWFTCDHENFRYSCTYCNSIRKNPETGESAGKGDHFPLLSGVRAQDRRDRETEDKVLIDPCDSDDVRLLDFTQDGRTTARYPKQKIRNQRAMDSIRYYHLDHPDLVESRRQLGLQIQEWIESADAIHNELDQPDPKIKKAFKGYISSIKRAISNEAPFSKFARKMVKGYQSYQWVEDLLEES